MIDLNKVHFTDVILQIDYEEAEGTKYDFFKREFDTLSEFEQDPIGEWVKIAKAKREIDEMMM